MRFLLTAITALFAANANASTYSVEFSFLNWFDSNSLVEGVADGLTLDGVSQATSVRITTASFGTGEYITPTADVRLNRWVLDDQGFVTAVDFLSQLPGASGLTPPAFALTFTNTRIIGQLPGTGLVRNRTAIIQTAGANRLRLEQGVPSAAVVPLPGAALLLLGALGGLAALRRRAA